MMHRQLLPYNSAQTILLTQPFAALHAKMAGGVLLQVFAFVPLAGWEHGVKKVSHCRERSCLSLASVPGSLLKTHFLRREPGNEASLSCACTHCMYCCIIITYCSLDQCQNR